MANLVSFFFCRLPLRLLRGWEHASVVNQPPISMVDCILRLRSCRFRVGDLLSLPRARYRTPPLRGGVVSTQQRAIVDQRRPLSAHAATSVAADTTMTPATVRLLRGMLSHDRTSLARAITLGSCHGVVAVWIGAS